MSTVVRPSILPDYVFKVTGMMCQQNCAATVQRAISTVADVEFVEVSFPREEALVWGRNAVVENIITEVEDMGYEAVLNQPDTEIGNPVLNDATSDTSSDITLLIKGMLDSVACPKKIQDIVTSVDGVFNVKVDFNSKRCYIWGFPEIDDVVEVLAKDGYGARDVNVASAKKKKPESSSGNHNNTEDCITLNLDHLMRGSTLKVVETSLKNITGVKSVSVDVEGRIVKVYPTESGDSGSEKVVEGVKKLGYSDALIQKSSSRRELLFEVTGMSCANCAMRIEKALGSLPGISASGATNVTVSAMTNKAKVTLDEGAVDAVGPRSIIEKVTSMGYGCSLYSIDGVAVQGQGDTADAAEEDGLSEWYFPLIVSVVLGVPVMTLHLSMSSSSAVMMMFDMPAACHGGVRLMQAIMLLLNLPILLIVGYRYYRGAVIGAMHGTFGMDCLVTTGTSITFLYSCVQLGLACHSETPTTHVFFETTGMLLMFVTIGKFIEAYAKRRSFAAISNLLKLQPREALLVVHSDIDFSAESSTDSLSARSVGGNTPLKVKKLGSLPAPHAAGHVTATGTASGTGSDSASKNTGTKEETKVISLDLVQRGDVLKVFPGDRIPTDAVVLRGSSFVDESMITGESSPVLKKKGDQLFGSTVNQNNVLYISVTSLGSESALAQIVKLVEAAQMNKAPVQAYADRVAGVFTPIILVLAVVTFVVWCSLSVTHVVPASWFRDEHNDPYLFSMIFAISVVVISCPCALGLATPTAIMAGTSVGAANGILIKGGGAFETAHKINTVIFDKTGTLTEGKPAITDIVVLRAQRKGSISPAQMVSEENEDVQQTARDELLRLAASAEQSSDHPLSRAVLEAARRRGLVLHALAEDATVLYVGSGVQCDTGFGVVLVGNRVLMEDQQVPMTSLVDAAMWDLEIQGKTAVCVAVDGVVRGVLGLADTAKPEAYSTIKALAVLGMDVWMVTGDNRTTAEALAEELDLPKDRILAGVLPKDKVAKVQELQAQGRFVAMVGDGINDSPALAQAHLGIAIGAGTEVAIEAADMVLIRSNLHDLVVALDLARLVFSRIKLNFVWALIYNLLAVPYAAGIWFPWTHLVLPPQYAGLSMAASSVSVVLSSMALWLYKRPAYLTDDSAMRKKLDGTILQRAQRELVSLRNNLAGKGKELSEGIVMNILKSSSNSTVSMSTLSSAANGTSGSNVSYKQLARTEREAELESGDQYVL